MSETKLYLTDQELVKLNNVAKSLGVSVEDVVKAAVKKFLQKNSVGKKKNERVPDSAK